MIGSGTRQLKKMTRGLRKIDSEVGPYSRGRKVSGVRAPHEQLVSWVAENAGGVANHYARQKIHYAGGIPDVVVLNGKKIEAIHEIEVPWGKQSNLALRNRRLVKTTGGIDRWLWIALPPRTEEAFNHVVLIV